MNQLVFDLDEVNGRLQGTRRLVLVIVIAGGIGGEGFIVSNLLDSLMGVNTILGQSLEGAMVWAAFGVLTSSALAYLVIKGPMGSLYTPPLQLSVTPKGFSVTYRSGTVQAWNWDTFHHWFHVIEFRKAERRPASASSWIQLGTISGIMIPDEACQPIVSSAKAAGWKVKASTEGFPKNSPGTNYSLGPP